MYDWYVNVTVQHHCPVCSKAFTRTNYAPVAILDILDCISLYCSYVIRHVTGNCTALHLPYKLK